MTTWFTADLHLGHTNIIKYCNRPFIDADQMTDALIANWNAVVDPADTVWVLGDFALGRIDETLPRTAQLHGQKLLLAGNHDRCWAGHPKRVEEWTERYLEAGFAQVHQGVVPQRIGDVEVLMCHFPYRGDSHDHDRHVEDRPVDEGAWLLHGHVHNQWLINGRMINVGVDVQGLRPISDREIASLIAAGDADRAHVGT